MIDSIRKKIDEIEKPIIKIMKNGFKFSLAVCIVAAGMLLTYMHFDKTPELYYEGILLFKTGIAFIAEFLVCGFAIDKIKKQVD